MDLEKWVKGNCLLSLFICHTTASLIIQENSDNDVLMDLKTFFQRLVPKANDPSMDYLRHRLEGPDDMPCHIKAALLPSQISIPVINNFLGLGKWQGVFVFEHRATRRVRQVIAQILPTTQIVGSKP